MEFSAKTRACFWFGKGGEEAADFYVSLMPKSKIENVVRPDPGAEALVIEFTLGGMPYMILNGGPKLAERTEFISISVLTEDQAETDHLWKTLCADGGEPWTCGWLRDKYGLSWQIVPKTMPRMLADPDRAAASRVMEAMFKMTKLDIAVLEAAFKGGPAT